METTNVMALEDEQLVVFKLETQEFGVAIKNVKEIIRLPEITKIPNTQEYMEGIINLRGKVIPVLNLKTILEQRLMSNSQADKVIIIETAGFNFGILVDDVSEVLKIRLDSIEIPTMGLMGQSRYLRGVGKLSQDRLLVLLDVDNLLTMEELEALDLVS